MRHSLYIIRLRESEETNNVSQNLTMTCKKEAARDDEIVQGLHESLKIKYYRIVHISQKYHEERGLSEVKTHRTNWIQVNTI